MGWIDALRGKKAGLDTAPFIYFIEENQTYLSLIRPFFEALDQGSFTGITSAVTLLEVLVQPFRRNAVRDRCGQDGTKTRLEEGMRLHRSPSPDVHPVCGEPRLVAAPLKERLRC